MVKVIWTFQAAEDLKAITEFIAQDSVHYAHMFAVSVVNTVDRIANFPESGRIVLGVNNRFIREIILGNYRIIYRIQQKSLEILTIYHGARFFDPGKVIGHRS